MKNYQFIVVTVLILALAGYLVYNNTKKCGCHEVSDIVE